MTAILIFSGIGKSLALRWNSFSSASHATMTRGKSWRLLAGLTPCVS